MGILDSVLRSLCWPNGVNAGWASRVKTADPAVEGICPMSLRGVLTLLALGTLLSGDAWAETGEKIAKISFGDVIERGGPLDSKGTIDKSFQQLRDMGYTTIYWRMLWEGHPAADFILYSSIQLREIQLAKGQFENTRYAWDPHELRYPIEVAHRLGMKFYAWVVPYNEGAPVGAWSEHCHEPPGTELLDENTRIEYGIGCPAYPYRYPWGVVYETQDNYQTKFVHEHPQYQLVDREGKHYDYGVLEWAYPEAREYWVKDIQLILDKYDVDGIHLDTRTEGMGPEYADQYGFNEPIVKEYERRYGVNILEEDFDLEQWRSLRGEYFTQLLREIAQVVHAKGKRFSVATSRGDYIGFPLGNMKLEWRKWIAEQILDSLVLEEHGWSWSRQGYGYVTDFPTGRGLKPFTTDIREEYGPLSEKYRVDLYFSKSTCYKPRVLADQCCNSRATMSTQKLPPGACERMAAMPEFRGTVDLPGFLYEAPKSPGSDGVAEPSWWPCCP